MWHGLVKWMAARASCMLKDDRSWIHLVAPRSRSEVHRGGQLALRADDAEAGCLEEFARDANDRGNHFVLRRQRPKEPENDFQFWLPSLPQALAFEQERREDGVAAGHRQRSFET